MSLQSCFVTGTDTDVGKTFVSSALLLKLRGQGRRVVGFKPVAAGSNLVNGIQRNEDAVRLHAASGAGFALDQINPVCLPDACSPHIAAMRADVKIEIPGLVKHFETLREQADVVVVEGAGGFIVPLGDDIDSAQLAQALGLPMILVVGLRLGCLNHALLTMEAIVARGLHCAGWVGNLIDADMPFLDENIATLKRRLAVRCLGILPRLAAPDDAVPLLDI